MKTTEKVPATFLGKSNTTFDLKDLDLAIDRAQLDGFPIGKTIVELDAPMKKKTLSTPIGKKTDTQKKSQEKAVVSWAYAGRSIYVPVVLRAELDLTFER